MGPRHVELVVHELCSGGGKAAATPGTDAETRGEKDGAEEDFVGYDLRRYRALAARCDDISIGRSDTQFCVKEACREMSRPTASAMRRFQRVAGYLKNEDLDLFEH